MCLAKGQRGALPALSPNTCRWTTICVFRLYCGVGSNTHFPIYADNTRCIEHKALICGWLWCLIHSLTWQWPLKMPLGCLQKVGKQIEMFSIFLRLIYQPPASLSLIVEAQKRLVFRVLFSVGLSWASDISCFWWPRWVWTYDSNHNILQFWLHRMV